MAYYQLRLPEEMDLNALLERSAAEMLAALGRAGLGWPGGELEARRELRVVFDKHVSAFDTCGCSSLCDEQVGLTEWNPGSDSRLVSSHPDERDKLKRFQLRVFHGGLDSLAQSTARFVLHASGNQHQPGSAAEDSMASAFISVMGPHVFQGQLCRHLELCASATQVDPWNRP